MLLAGLIMCMNPEPTVALNNTEAMLYQYSEVGKIVHAQCHVFSMQFTWVL